MEQMHLNLLETFEIPSKSGWKAGRDSHLYFYKLLSEKNLSISVGEDGYLLEKIFFATKRALSLLLPIPSGTLFMVLLWEKKKSVQLNAPWDIL